ncbi:MAG: hypothetical protein V4537_14460 [Pseudomonadota bacterium]
MTIALSDLLPPFTVDDAKAVLLALVDVPENKVTNWYPGAVFRTMLELEALVVQDAGAGAVPGVAAEGYATTAEGESLTEVAASQWDIERDPPGFPIQVVTLACDAGHGPYIIASGRFIGRATDGSLYSASTGGTLSTSSTLTIDMAAMSPGALRGLVSAPDTPLPGVTVIAAAVKVVTGIPQLGADEEPDEKVRGRCADRLPDVDATPDEDRLIKWAKAAVDSTTRYRIDPDDTNPGGAIFTVAGASGAIPGGDVTAIQAYVRARLGITDYVTVQNATNATITPGGTATVSRARTPAVKAAANDAWVAYLSAAKVGAEVFLEQLTKAVMDAGAINFTAATLNAVADDFALSPAEVPVPSGLLADDLDWLEI